MIWTACAGAWPVTTFPWNARDLFCRYFFPGGAYDTDFARSASPIDFVHGHVPPILIVHGAKDTVVPPQQALAFAAKLHEAGVEATVRIDPDRDHDVMTGQAEEEALKFFAQVLMPDIHPDLSKPTPPAQSFPDQVLT